LRLTRFQPSFSAPFDPFSAPVYSLNVPTADQLFDQRTLQTHIAPNSRSNLLYKNALQDDSKTIFSGLIIVEENAQQTDAYQTNNNLLLSDKAEANSLPGLEIKANDVKCSHGATSGQIDDSNIFYFLARGIPRKKAEELLVFGFFEEIIEKFAQEELRDYIRELLENKLR
jgi:Fe-S cluster assembly protein SufD